MADSGLPPGVEAFILAHVPSVAHLEALLLLRNEPQARWTADKLAARLFINPKEGADILADLVASGLAARTDDVHGYAPGTPELAAAVDETAETYRVRLIPVTKFIHARPRSPARAFADAFRFRKG